MNSLDILHYALTLGVLVITICIAAVAFFLIMALKSLAKMAENIEQTSQSIKDKIQMKALAALPAVLVSLVGKVIKRRG